MSDVAYFQQKVMEAQAEIGKGLIGQTEIVRQTLLAMLSGGNVLLEGMPGLGKTHLVRTISKVFDLPFKRIQFTPDLMPGDVTGTKIIVKKGEETGFRFEPGPIFSSLVLADEINRATPKTQSALLEAMQEHTVTVGTDTYKMPEPFMVLATQNPIEQEGTYILSEAQLDRFLLKLKLFYPKPTDELEILNRIENGTLDESCAVASVEDLVFLQGLQKKVYIDNSVKKYIVDIVQATRFTDKILSKELSQYVAMGASTRAAIAFMNVSKAVALMKGRNYVTPDDVKSMRYSVLRHRITLNFAAIADGVSEETIIDAIFGSVKAP